MEGVTSGPAQAPVPGIAQTPEGRMAFKQLKISLFCSTGLVSCYLHDVMCSRAEAEVCGRFGKSDSVLSRSI